MKCMAAAARARMHCTAHGIMEGMMFEEFPTPYRHHGMQSVQMSFPGVNIPRTERLAFSLPRRRVVTTRGGAIISLATGIMHHVRT
jgi:hypothetical protein